MLRITLLWKWLNKNLLTIFSRLKTERITNEGHYFLKLWSFEWNLQGIWGFQVMPYLSVQFNSPCVVSKYYIIKKSLMFQPKFPISLHTWNVFIIINGGKKYWDVLSLLLHIFWISSSECLCLWLCECFHSRLELSIYQGAVISDNV